MSGVYRTPPAVRLPQSRVLPATQVITLTLLQGLNFRGTAGYVTDGADEAPALQSTTYPTTTAQGVVVGWESLPSGSLDRENTNDRRLAGAAGVTNDGSTVAVFRIDLPATGNYVIRIAAGDGLVAQKTKLELFDNVTSLGVLVNSQTQSVPNAFFDATGVERLQLDWAANNVSITKTFASTICRFKIGGAPSGLTSVLAHIRIENASLSGSWKTTNALVIANIKTVNGLAKASIKTMNGLTP